MEKIKVLNEKPRITYVEKDYKGLMGYINRMKNETQIIFTSNANEKIKTKFKELTVKNILNPKQYR